MKGVEELRELSVAQDLLKACQHYIRTTGAAGIAKIVLGVGELQDLDLEGLERYFRSTTLGTAVQDAQIQVVRYPILCHCRTCKEDYILCPDAVVSAVCPVCNATSHDLISGAQMRIEAICATEEENRRFESAAFR